MPPRVGLGQRSPRVVPPSSPRRSLTESIFHPPQGATNFIFGAPEASKSDRFSYRSSSAPLLLDPPPGSILGPLWLQNVLWLSLVIWSHRVLFASFAGRCLPRLPFKIWSLRTLREKGACAFGNLPTRGNQWVFTMISYSRRRRAHSKEGNRGQTRSKNQVPKIQAHLQTLTICGPRDPEG